MSGLGSLVGKITDPGDFFGAQGAQSAAAGQERAAAESIAEIRRQFDVTQEGLKPFQEAELRQTQERQALLGLLGPGAESEALGRFKESPGQKFLRERGEKAITRNAAAIGGLGGGNVREALTEFGVGTAAQQFNQRLAQLSGQPSSTLAGAQFGQQATSGITQQLTESANARASGIAGQQAARSNLLSTGVGVAGAIFSDARLKKSPKIVGKLPNGLNWYIWEWFEWAKYLVGDQRPEGVMAHEAAELFPDSVTTHSSGYLNVDMARFN